MGAILLDKCNVRWFGMTLLLLCAFMSSITVGNGQSMNMIFPDTTILSDDVIMSTPFPSPSATIRVSSTAAVSDVVVTQTPMASIVTVINSTLSMEFVGSGSCNCDLLVGDCDTLCCCDTDCTDTERAVFDCPQMDSSNEVCVDTSQVLLTSLPRCTCDQDSFLCIMMEQDSFRLRYGDPPAIDSASEFSSTLASLSQPNVQPLLQLERQTFDNNFYQVGDPILATRSGVMDYLTLPSSLNGLHCHDSNPIAYLKDGQEVCERSTDQLQTTCSTFSAFDAYEDISILQNPVDGAVVNITVSGVRCQQDMGVCPLSPPIYDPDTGLCTNVLVEAQYSLVHNGTGQVVSATVDLVLGPIQDGGRYSLTFGVKFIKSSSLDDGEVVLQRSGNPGYLDGQPLLAGTLTNMASISLSVDPSMWMIIPQSSSECGVNVSSLSVNFREDTHTSCKLRVLPSETCTDICTRALESLPALPMDTHIGIFGNSDPQDLTQWLPVLHNSVQCAENQAAGAVCDNVVTSLQITVLYSYTNNFNSPEAVLSGTQYLYNTESIAPSRRDYILLQTSVQFIEVSTMPSYALDPIGDTVYKLPYDFLYPFFVSSSSSPQGNSLILFTLIILQLVIVKLLK